MRTDCTISNAHALARAPASTVRPCIKPGAASHEAQARDRHPYHLPLSPHLLPSPSLRRLVPAPRHAQCPMVDFPRACAWTAPVLPLVHHAPAPVRTKAGVKAKVS
jgi:hypothetical protein